MKKLLLTTALIGGIVSYSSNAYAVTDAEFEALRAQMSVFANQLNAMEESQNALKAVVNPHFRVRVLSESSGHDVV